MVVVLLPSNSRVPWGLPGAEQSFYNVEQNPLAVGIKVGAEESQPQLLGTTKHVRSSCDNKSSFRCR